LFIGVFQELSMRNLWNSAPDYSNLLNECNLFYREYLLVSIYFLLKKGEEIMKKDFISQLKLLLNLCRPGKHSQKGNSAKEKEYEDITIQEYDPYIEGLTKQVNIPEQTGSKNSPPSNNHSLAFNAADNS
jgi:hypothetical protein